jgi:hypothetical protein
MIREMRQREDAGNARHFRQNIVAMVKSRL